MNGYSNIQADCRKLNDVLSVLSIKYCIPVLYLLANRSGTTRFNELRRSIGDISCKTLSSTLKKMEEHSLLLRTEYPQIPPRVEYSLTSRGWSLLPLLDAMCSWGSEHPRVPP